MQRVATNTVYIVCQVCLAEIVHFKSRLIANPYDKWKLENKMHLIFWKRVHETFNALKHVSPSLSKIYR